MPNDGPYPPSSEWYRSAHYSTPSSNEEVLTQVAQMQQTISELSETCRQLQAMIWELWSGERSEVIITPPRQSRGDDTLRLDT